MPVILSLCDLSTIMVKPWAEAGFPCYCVDIQHEQSVDLGNIHLLKEDLRWWIPPRHWDIRLVFAFPPCTHLAVSGARWFRGKGLRALADGLELVERCRIICEWAGSPWMLENPVSTLSSYWREPDYTFNPCDYGDPYTKRTCLWTGGNFIMPQKRPVLPLEASKMNRLPPSPDRANLRSVIPEGFAQAVFDANVDIALQNTPRCE